MFRVEELVPQDRAQWLNGSWGFTRVKSEPSPILTHFVEVSSASDAARIRRYEAWDSYKESVTPLAQMECYCHWPLGGAINVPLRDGSVAAVMGRRAERQYRRSYVPGLMTLEFPKLWDATKKFGPLVSELRTSFANVVWGAFFPSYPSAPHALDSLREKRTCSVAISPSLVLVGDGATVLIFDKMKHVGEIKGGHVLMTYADDYVTRRIQKHITMKLEGMP